MGDARDRDQLLDALAEVTAFFASEGRARIALRRPSPERSRVLQWLSSLRATERTAVCTVVDAAFVRLVIEMKAAAKSKLKARIDQFHVLRPLKAKEASRATFSRRPLLRTRDGDDLALPYSAPYDEAATELVASLRIFNGTKSCDTISPSTTVVEDVDRFVRLMDVLSKGHFLAKEPSEATLKTLPWAEQPWLADLGYYSLATYVAHQMELQLWRHFKTQSVPSIGLYAKRHLVAQWVATDANAQAAILLGVQRETKTFLLDFGGRSWPALRSSLSLVTEIMQPAPAPVATPEAIFSCGLAEAGARPQFALIKMLWAEHLQTACTGLLEASLVPATLVTTTAPTTSLSAKQRKRKEHKRQAKEKKREKELHALSLGLVHAEMRRQFKQAQRDKAIVKQVLDDLVERVVALAPIPPKPKRAKKKKKKVVAMPPMLHSGDERMPGFLLLNLDQVPVTPPRRRRVSVEATPGFDAPLDISTFLTPQKPSMRYQHYFIEDEDESNDFGDAFAAPFSLPSPTPDATFYFPGPTDDPACEWYLPSSVLSQSSGSREEWSAFGWRPDDDATYQKDRTVWRADVPAPTCRYHVDASTSPTTTTTVPDEQATRLEALQRQCDEYASNVAALTTEMAALQTTVAELQSTLFRVQAELAQWKQEQSSPPPPPPPPVVTTPEPAAVLTPFVSVPLSLLPPRSKLHWDICEFVSQLQAETQHRLAAHTAVSRFCVSAVQALWPRAQVRPYGSFVTGLSLPSSDLDLVICLPKVRRDEPAEAPGVLEGRNAIKETWQQHLARKLRTEPWVVPESVKTIPNASIPIITLLTTSPYNVRLDISFEGPGHNGLATNDLVHSFVHELPALTPLMLVLKTFIIERGLGVAYTGGLSSYALLLLVTRFLQEFTGGNCFDATVATQCNQSVSAQSASDFGTMLLGFMDFYGNKLDPRATGISVATRSFLSREHHQYGPVAAGWHAVQMEHVQFENLNLSSPGSRRQHLHHRDNWATYDYDPHKFDPVYIEDPLRPANNVGRNCFRIMQIRRALANAFVTLTEPTPLPSSPYVGGVALHPTNLLRSILSCTPEPKWKGFTYPLVLEATALASPVRHTPRERTVTSASKSKDKHKPKRRHSACVNDLLTKPVLDDGAVAYSSLSPSRSLSFADVVIGKSTDTPPDATRDDDDEG